MLFSNRHCSISTGLSWLAIAPPALPGRAPPRTVRPVSVKRGDPLRVKMPKAGVPGVVDRSITVPSAPAPTMRTSLVTRGSANGAPLSR